jgi:phenylalanyl-tRNA synthetase beta chain
VKISADVIEEIARVVGYDRLPVSLPHIQVSNVPILQKRIFRKGLAQLLLSLGLDEIITYSLTSRKNLERTNLASLEAVHIQNPLSQDQEILRPALLPSFLPVVAANLNRGQKDLGLFEIGKVYARTGEKENLGIILTGYRSADWRRGQKEEVNFFDIKGIVERISEKAGLKISFVQKDEAFLEAGQAASAQIGSKALGFLGKLSNEVLDKWDIRAKNVFFAQLDIEKLFELQGAEKRFMAIPEFPAVVRDISLAVKKDISFEQIKKVVEAEGAELLSSIRLIEEYMGDKISAGYRGVIFSLMYQSPTRTLREEEINQVHNRIGQALVDRLGAIKR